MEDTGAVPSVKTAISLPDDVFEGIEALARQRGASRSGIIAEACRNLLLTAATQELMDGWNAEADAMTDADASEEHASLRAGFRRRVQLLDQLGYTWKE